MLPFVSLFGVVLGISEPPNGCTKTPLPAAVSERPNDGLQRPSAILSQGDTDWLFLSALQSRLASETEHRGR